MLCQECQKKPATVHMTKIVNNKKTEVHLCEECAREHNSFQMFTPFSINDFLASLMDAGKTQTPLDKRAGISCDSCKMSYYEFKKTGRLGCGDCYRAFRSQLSPVLKRIQGGIQHTGKLPRKAGIKIRLARDIDKLKGQLQSAIEKEAFEEAAEIRDRIREYERQMGEK